MTLLAVHMQGKHWLVIPLRSRWCSEARAVVARAPSCRPSQLRSTRLVRAVRVCSKGRASPGRLVMLRQPCKLRLCRSCMPADTTGLVEGLRACRRVGGAIPVCACMTCCHKVIAIKCCTVQMWPAGKYTWGRFVWGGGLWGGVKGRGSGLGVGPFWGFVCRWGGGREKQVCSVAVREHRRHSDCRMSCIQASMNPVV